MTRDDIIRMAREAWLDGYGTPLGGIEHFATLIAAAEREACAKVCEAIAQQMEDEGEGPTGYIGWVIDCVAAIRARGRT